MRANSEAGSLQLLGNTAPEELSDTDAFAPFLLSKQVHEWRAPRRRRPLAPRPADPTSTRCTCFSRPLIPAPGRVVWVSPGAATEGPATRTGQPVRTRVGTTGASACSDVGLTHRAGTSHWREKGFAAAAFEKQVFVFHIVSVDCTDTSSKKGLLTAATGTYRPSSLHPVLQKCSPQPRQQLVREAPAGPAAGCGRGSQSRVLHGQEKLMTL
ncbi:hypothetical protein CB1_001437004 [Camelus ferus]|nr:hypothetical protein CB1_001437004 [Camelus ferus]